MNTRELLRRCGDPVILHAAICIVEPGPAFVSRYGDAPRQVTDVLLKHIATKVTVVSEQIGEEGYHRFQADVVAMTRDELGELVRAAYAVGHQEGFCGGPAEVTP